MYWTWFFSYICGLSKYALNIYFLKQNQLLLLALFTHVVSVVLLLLIKAIPCASPHLKFSLKA